MLLSPISLINTKYNISKSDLDSSNYQHNFIMPKLNPKKDSLSFGCNFFLTKIPRVPCAYCGKRMLTTNDVKTFAEIFHYKTGEDVILTLESQYSKLDIQHKKIFDFLISKINKQPFKKVTNILAEIAASTEKNTDEKYTAAIQKALQEARIEPYSETSKKLQRLVERSYILNNTRISDAKTKQNVMNFAHFKGDVHKLLLASKDQKELEQLRQFLATLGREHELIKFDPTIFFPKYNTMLFEDFLANLFHPIMSSAEHLTPQARGGIDNQSNYLAVCKQCNNVERGVKNFADFIKKHPDVPQNIKKQLLFLDELIIPMKKDFEFPFNENQLKIGDYLIEIIPEIEKELGAPINIEMPHYQRYLDFKKSQSPVLVLGGQY